jgi:hypothetical protein
VETRAGRPYGARRPRDLPPERPDTLDFFDLVAQVIDLRSFSNLWFWIVLGILWSAMSQRVMGVPYHVIQRARRGDADSIDDMHALAEITARRLLNLTHYSGVPLMATVSFNLTVLAVLGWGYEVEFCQAVFLLLLPFSLVGALSIRTAKRLWDSQFTDLARQLRLHRMMVQALAVVFIFITAFWGMYVNVVVGPFG